MLSIMTNLTPQQCAQLEAHGLKIFPPVAIGQLSPEYLHQSAKPDHDYAYSLKFKAPVMVWGNCFLRTCAFGAYSYCNANSSLNLCSIGNYCSLGSNLSLGLPQHNMTGFSSSAAFSSHEPFMMQWRGCPPWLDSAYYPITIGHDVWIGNNVVIPAAHPITIGTGAIIAAGAVVTHDVPPYTIVAGNPAHVVKQRFSDELCADLLSSNWFDYDLPRCPQRDDLAFQDPKLFLERFAQCQEQIPRLPQQYLKLI